MDEKTKLKALKKEIQQLINFEPRAQTAVSAIASENTKKTLINDTLSRWGDFEGAAEIFDQLRAKTAEELLDDVFERIRSDDSDIPTQIAKLTLFKDELVRRKGNSLGGYHVSRADAHKAAERQRKRSRSAPPDFGPVNSVRDPREHHVKPY